jgi:hypothetical protein
MPSQHTVATHLEQRRRCSRCQVENPPCGFYRNPASICKQCHNAATGLNNAVRRAAIALLISAHREEYRRLLIAERARCLNGSETAAGGGPNAA